MYIKLVWNTFGFHFILGDKIVAKSGMITDTIIRKNIKTKTRFVDIIVYL